MAVKSISKTAYYLRAKNGNKPINLQSLIINARKIKSTVADSEVKLAQGDIIRIQHFRNSNDGVFVHLARYIPGEFASTLQPKAKVKEDNEGVQAPPDGKEFKEGDSFMLVNEHHVLFCSHGISLSKSSNYLAQLFKNSNINKNICIFDLNPASNLNKLKLIQDHGVRSIQLSSNAFDLSLPKPQRKNWISRGLGSISDELGAMLEKDKAAEEMKSMEDLLVNVEVKLNGNTRAVVEAQAFIEQVAENVLNDKDAPISEFTITTQSGEKITSNDIRLKASFNVAQQNQSVTYDSVWNGLKNYFNDMKQNNLLEQ